MALIHIIGIEPEPWSFAFHKKVVFMINRNPGNEIAKIIMPVIYEFVSQGIVYIDDPFRNI